MRYQGESKIKLSKPQNHTTIEYYQNWIKAKTLNRLKWLFLFFHLNKEFKVWEKSTSQTIHSTCLTKCLTNQQAVPP